MHNESSIVQRERVLITVLTYPHPSESYEELVCTAGITESGEWVRLYPIDYRYRPKNQQFKKFQWIEVDLEPKGAGNDKRKESRRPILDTIKILGDPLPTSDDWRARTSIIDKLQHSTMKELEARFETDQTSLGIVRPTEILEVKYERVDQNWKGSWQDLQNQLRLFDPQPKKLEKLPYKWSYVFRCEDRKEPYTRMIEDWELGANFLNAREKYDEAKAAEKVCERYMKVVADPSRDVRFFVGTHFPYNTWLVIGVFWPPKVNQTELPF